MAGGIWAILYIVVTLIIPTFMVLIPQYDFQLGGPALMNFIASNRAWWMLLQAVVLESSILATATEALFPVTGFAYFYCGLQSWNDGGQG